jgi:hypothetical protein
MKKTLVVALLAGVMVMAFAGAAFAISPSYVDWNAGGVNAGTSGPHSNYLLTTEKCAVCHAVHAAATSNAAAGLFGPSATDAAETQMLLRSSVADACTYCHITTNVAGLQIYNADATKYTASDVYGHNGSTSAECADCHAVHGADTFKGYIGGKILKANLNTVANTSGAVQTEAATTLNALVTAGTNVFGATAVSSGNVGDIQVTAFCTRCHKTFSDASETTITASGYFEAYDGTVGSGNQSYKNHPLKNFESGNFTANGDNITVQAAWVDASTCRSCHAAGDTRVSTSYAGTGGVVAWSFPHWTNGNASFLVAGWGSTDGLIGVADDHSSVTGKPAGSHAVADAGEDGVCLRCHTNGSAAGNATAGVNVTF